MRKGQISIDLIFALIVALIASGSFILISDSFKESNSKMMLENQLSAEATNIATFITSSNVMSGTTFIAEKSIGTVFYKGQVFHPDVNILADLNKVVVSTKTEDLTITKEAYFGNPQNARIVIDNRVLVIRND